jgi:hypothetical protein
LSTCLDYNDYEYCPNCGNYSKLVESSGFCHACTKEHSIANGNNLCTDCGTEIPESHQRKLCWDCKEERWLKKYGDVIEYLMITGMSFNKARGMVADAIRPLCVVCAGPIKGGTPGESLFCSATLACKRARNKYRRLVAGGMAPNRAINQAIK